MTDHQILVGDVLAQLKSVPDHSFDDVFCDPPYGISFMGKEWDHGVPSAEVWREIFRVLKPGGHLLAYGGTRMWHRLAVNIEDAGFEIRDTFMWLYGSGFPKAYDISKGIDKAAGEKREAVGTRVYADGTSARAGAMTGTHGRYGTAKGNPVVTAPATSEAEQWDGYKTALKPAWEPIVVAMKPTEGTYVENALEHGVAGLNIDGSRISGPPSQGGAFSGESALGQDSGWNDHENKKTAIDRSMSQGRFPANLVLSHTPECVQMGVKKVKGQNPKYASEGKGEGGYMEGWKGRPKGEGIGYASEDGTETVENWECSPECPIRQLDEQTGELKSGSRKSGNYRVYQGDVTYGDTWSSSLPELKGDSGGASRFFYNAKASKSEREAGLEPVFDEKGKQKRANTHPTVKPIDLNRYFANLILPPERDTPRKLLVPFSGVGSEMIGALLAGWDHVTGIEIDPDYVAKAEKRIEHWLTKDEPEPFLEPEPIPEDADLPEEIDFDSMFT